MHFLKSLYNNPYVILTLASLGWAFNAIAEGRRLHRPASREKNLKT